MIKDKKLMKFISGLGTTACCLLAAGFLFAAAPMTAHAVPLGSNPGGASTNTDEGAAGDDAEAGGAEDTGDTGNEGAGEAAGGSVTSATVTSGSVNVRSEASTDASVAGKATQGMEVTVTGETQGSDGKTWYAVSFESNGSTVTGYIRSDLVEAHVAEPEPAPQETETPEEQPAAPTEEYGVVYEDDGTGTSYWYLHDNTMGTKYKVEDLLNAEKTNQSNMDAMEKTTSSMRLVIIIMAVVILVLIVVVTVFIIKLKNAYEGADYDGYDDDDDDDEEDEDDEDEDEEERPRRRSFGSRFASRRDEEDEDDEEDEEDEDEEDDEEEERPRRHRKPAPRKASRRVRYEDEDEDEEDEDEDDYEEERPRRKASRSKEKGWQSKNFLDDDDLEFEFLDLK